MPSRDSKRRFFAGPESGTKALLALCLANFTLMILLDRRIPIALFPGVFGFWGGAPTLSSVLRTGGIWGPALDLEPYRAVSAIFVHLGLDHLAFNSLALWSLGRGTEARFGGARTIVFFLVTGVMGYVASRLYFGQLSPVTAGASGAVFGLLGVRIGELVAMRDPRVRDMIFEQLAYAVGFALLFSVNNAAHAGGALSGVALGYLSKPRLTSRGESAFGYAAALGLAAAVASVLLSFFSLAWR